MKSTEIMRMAFFEKEHWWYCGLRDMIQRVLQAHPLRSRPRILDAGCGTGENLRFLRRRLGPSYIGGFDVSPLAVDLCRRKVPDADIYVTDLRDPELHAADLDLVLSCDVISCPGVDDCRPGLARLVEALQSGGLLILNLPAHQWLYSQHDEAVGTRQRVSAEETGQLLKDLKLHVELVTYRIFSLFPAVVAARLPSLFQSTVHQRAQSDLKPTRPWINGALTTILSAENRAVSQGMRWPWGSSVFAVGRKD